MDSVIQSILRQRGEMAFIPQYYIMFVKLFKKTGRQDSSQPMRDKIHFLSQNSGSFKYFSINSSESRSCKKGNFENVNIEYALLANSCF